MKLIFSIFIIFLLFTSILHAQQVPTIKSTISKNKLLIGEPIELTIETEASSPLFIRLDSIPHFEFSDPPKIDTIKQGSTSRVKGVYKITSFDSGRWFIPSFHLNNSVKTDSIPVEVIFSDFDPAQDYHDIKDIIEVKVSKKKFPWWWIAAGVVIVAALIYYFTRKKKIIPVRLASKGISPYEEAMQSLDQLYKNRGNPKLFYSSLTDIFRVYLFRSNGIRSLQKTTDDLIIQVSSLGLAKPRFEQLAVGLRLSDFVKFAKYSPAPEDDENSFTIIRDSIHEIEQLKQAKVPGIEKISK